MVREYNIKNFTIQDLVLLITGSLFMLPIVMLLLEDYLSWDIRNYWIPIIYIACALYFMAESVFKITKYKELPRWKYIVHMVSFGLSIALIVTSIQLIMPNALSLGFLIEYSKYIGAVALVWYFVERFVR